MNTTTQRPAGCTMLRPLMKLHRVDLCVARLNEFVRVRKRARYISRREVMCT